MPMATRRAIVAAAWLTLCVLALPGRSQSLPALPPEVLAKCPDAIREAAQLRKAPRQEPATVEADRRSGRLSDCADGRLRRYRRSLAAHDPRCQRSGLPGGSTEAHSGACAPGRGPQRAG